MDMNYLYSLIQEYNNKVPYSNYELVTYPNCSFGRVTKDGSTVFTFDSPEEGVLLLQAKLLYKLNEGKVIVMEAIDEKELAYRELSSRYPVPDW